MVATLCLLGCVLAPAQIPDRSPAPPRAGERLLGPRLGKAQEFVYRGTFTEEATGGRVQFSRAYRFETRVFVLDAPPRGADVALLTVLRPRDAQAGAKGVSGEPAAASARLELARVDLQGRVTADPGVSLAVPVEGPPGVECGAFVELPSGRRAPQAWEVPEVGRPARAWRVAGSETVAGASCVKLTGLQQSEDWDRPRADRAAWRRTDTVWFAPRLGLAYRVERVVERREPARHEPTQRSTLRYELESTLQYPGRLFEDRRQDAVQAHAFAEAAAPLLVTPAKYGPQLNALLNKINYHLEHQPPTPYREAVLQVKRHVEAARRGEAPPAPPEESVAAPGVVAVGQPAPDFVAPDFTGPSAARLRRWLGRPTLLVFYSPASPTAPELLRFAQRVQSTYGVAVAVVGLSVSEDKERVLRQRSDLGLTFPVLNGSGLRVSYAVETTPKVVVVDGAGVVRGAYLGWGYETPGEVLQELRQWLKHP